MTVCVNELRVVSGLYAGVSTREGVLGRRAGQLFVVPQKPGEGTGSRALLPSEFIVCRGITSYLFSLVAYSFPLCRCELDLINLPNKMQL